MCAVSTCRTLRVQREAKAVSQPFSEWSRAQSVSGKSLRYTDCEWCYVQCECFFVFAENKSPDPRSAETSHSGLCGYCDGKEINFDANKKKCKKNVEKNKSNVNSKSDNPHSYLHLIKTGRSATKEARIFFLSHYYYSYQMCELCCSCSSMAVCAE